MFCSGADGRSSNGRDRCKCRLPERRRCRWVLTKLWKRKYVSSSDFKYSILNIARIAKAVPVTQGGRTCKTARPPVSASAGAPALAGSPSIRAFVAKSVLSRFTRFWMYRFQPFMVLNGYFMIMMLAQGCQVSTPGQDS